MSEGHVHVTTRCGTHGWRLGGCKCIAAEGGRVETIDCALGCPGHPDTRREHDGNWSDVHMGEPDVP